MGHLFGHMAEFGEMQYVKGQVHKTRLTFLLTLGCVNGCHANLHI